MVDEILPPGIRAGVRPLGLTFDPWFSLGSTFGSTSVYQLLRDNECLRSPQVVIYNRCITLSMPVTYDLPNSAKLWNLPVFFLLFPFMCQPLALFFCECLDSLQ